MHGDDDGRAARRGAAAAPFEGLGAGVFEFLGELERNNDRAWFHAQSRRFERDVRTPVRALVRAVGERLPGEFPRFQAVLSGSGGSILRIARDARFAGARPYHDSLALRFAHDGEDPRFAPALTLRLTSRGAIVGAGYRPAGPRTLQRMREALDRDRSGWAEVRAAPALRVVYGDLEPPDLVRVPRGWPREHPFAGDLRRTAFRVSRDLPLEGAAGPLLLDVAFAWWSAAVPLLRFVCAALELSWETLPRARIVSAPLSSAGVDDDAPADDGAAPAPGRVAPSAPPGGDDAAAPAPPPESEPPTRPVGAADLAAPA